MRIAFQMNHPRDLNPRGDSTFLMVREAQKRGYDIHFYTPDVLTLAGGHVTAYTQPLALTDDPVNYYILGEAEHTRLDTMDVVLLRQDPPFNMAYITSTYLLEMLPKKTFVTNNPASVRNNPEKLMPLMWPHFMPPTLITADIREMEEFRREHHDIIIKPLYGHGGRAILHVREDDGNLPAMVEMHLANSKEPLMVQRFLPEVKTEDRRIILFDGDVKGVLGRIPSEHEIRANFRTGGSPARAELTPRQREICDTIKPILKEKGLLFAGLDVIGDYLTEINITSPTGFVQANAMYGTTLEADFWNTVESHL